MVSPTRMVRTMPRYFWEALVFAVGVGCALVAQRVLPEPYLSDFGLVVGLMGLVFAGYSARQWARSGSRWPSKARDVILPFDARIVAGTLVVIGIAAAAYNTYSMWISVVVPFVDPGKPLDPHRQQALARMGLGFMMVNSVFLLMFAAGVGIALVRGSSRPWIVTTSLLALLMSVGPTPSHAWEVVSKALFMFRKMPSTLTGARLLYLVAPSVAATLALAWFLLRGARWLPPAPWVHWIAATLWVGAMFCIVIW